MKKKYFIIFLLALIFSSVTFSQVSLPHYESFDYSIGSDLGTAPNWENYSGTSNEIDVISGTLSYSGLKNPLGNSINLKGGTIDSQILFSEVTTGEIFTSFILKVTDLSSITDFTDGGYFAIFASTTNSFHSRIWVRPNTNPAGTTFDLAVTNASSGTGFGTAHNVNDNLFIIMSYNTTSGVINLWVNPSSSDFEGSPPAVTSTVTDATANSVNRLLLRQDSNNETPGMTIDELRIGTTWAEVTPTEAVASINRNTVKGFITYPNPITDNRFTISSQSLELKQVVIFNVLGKKVLETSFSGVKKNINVATLNAGIYILKVKEAGKTATKKLVIR